MSSNLKEQEYKEGNKRRIPCCLATSSDSSLSLLHGCSEYLFLGTAEELKKYIITAFNGTDMRSVYLRVIVRVSKKEKNYSDLILILNNRPLLGL